MTSPRYRIAVDIGGTFTDLEILDEATGRVSSLKSPTTPDDPARGLVEALGLAGARLGFGMGEIGLILHGTTIATNAVLTDDLPQGALITTAGFEDVLEIGRHARTDIYALKAPKRRLLIPRRRRFGLVERIGAGGEALTVPTEAAMDETAAKVAATGVPACAIAFLNAFANPDHERAMAERLRAAAPGIAISCSHEVSPEIREFERTATTVLNALLMPVIAAYVANLRRRLAEAGIGAPVYLVQSNGGAIGLEAVTSAPVRLLLSGPSGGVLAAERLAGRLGMPDVVGVDMGGTSYDVSVVADGRRTVVTQGEIDGLPVRAPMVEMRTIGAGGGSVAHIDASGRLQVGPRSAGSVPGPVCYGRGGVEPTVTDVNLMLGRLDAATFLGGDFALDLPAARAALEEKVAAPLGMDADRAGAGVLAVLNATLAAAIKFALFQRGLDPRDFALMSFGGAGGLHACEVADEMGMTTVVFPRDPSTFSAHGILQSDILHDLSVTAITPLTEDAAPRIADMAAGLAARGHAALDVDALPADRRALALSADLRYRGQAFELMTPLEGTGFAPADVAPLRARFEALHRQRFSFDDPSEAVELVTLRLTAAGLLGGEAAPTAPAGGGAPTSRPVHVDGAWAEIPVHRQDSLGEGEKIHGPAIVEQVYTTLLIPGGWTLRVTGSGDMIAAKEASA